MICAAAAAAAHTILYAGAGRVFELFVRAIPGPEREERALVCFCYRFILCAFQMEIYFPTAFYFAYLQSKIISLHRACVAMNYGFNISSSMFATFTLSLDIYLGVIDFCFV